MLDKLTIVMLVKLILKKPRMIIITQISNIMYTMYNVHFA